MKTSRYVQVMAEVCAYTKTELSIDAGLPTYSTRRDNACIKSAHHCCFFLPFCFSPNLTNRLRVFRYWNDTTAPICKGGGSHVWTILFVLEAHCSGKEVVPMCILYQLCLPFNAVKKMDHACVCVCVCVLHIKPFFYSSTSSTPSVRTDSSP